MTNVARGVSVAHCRPARRFRYSLGARDAMMIFGTRLSADVASHHASRGDRALPPSPNPSSNPPRLPCPRRKTVFSGVARIRGETPPRAARPVAGGGAKRVARPSRFSDQLPVYLIAPWNRNHLSGPVWSRLGISLSSRSLFGGGRFTHVKVLSCSGLKHAAVCPLWRW